MNNQFNTYIGIILLVYKLFCLYTTVLGINNSRVTNCMWYMVLVIEHK